ncbi:AraC family transcriptional regulator [Jejubacter calystegiae]|uniref:AraC family transcriptional regulator n=1 Tax=Jejubacter calystegiae TaxID=2579935 RepID=A0A4P8YKB6_9ENTR|nr:AraC family transcriptional regulator [Jejubacter calystegiae]QCT21190.1 AraC family transcriptional regulator [Jejubacter calystegiae]
MTNTALLDLIHYDDLYTELRRVEGNSADYFHWHQCLEILYIESGVGLVIVDNQKFTARPGRLFIFPQNKLHKVKVDSDINNYYSRTIIHVDPEYIATFIRPFKSAWQLYSEMIADNAKVSIYDFSANMVRISHLLDSLTENYEATSKGEVIALFILNLLQLLPDGVFINSGSSGLLSSRMMHYVDQHFRSGITLEELASHLSLSGSHISRQFRKETGSTFQEYLIIRRIKYACYLLEQTELAVSEIALQSGFNYVTYFIKCFSQVTGTTPLRFKKNSRKPSKYQPATGRSP